MQQGSAQPSLEAPAHLDLPASSRCLFTPASPCSPLCISHSRWLHCSEAHLRPLHFISAAVNLSFRLYMWIFQQYLATWSSLSASSKALTRPWEQFCKGHSGSDFVPAWHKANPADTCCSTSKQQLRLYSSLIHVILQNLSTYVKELHLWFEVTYLWMRPFLSSV